LFSAFNQARSPEMLKIADGRPIAIMLEQSRGALVYALILRENVLLDAINPKQLSRFDQGPEAKWHAG